MAGKRKFYVVWSGRMPGIYGTWADCKAQVAGLKGAQYKSFATEEEAAHAYSLPYERVVARKPHKRTNKTPQNPPGYRHDTVLPLPPAVEARAWAVDAACSGNPGMMEYRGIDLETGAEVFHLKPTWGTNNIGEFLAIVHALALLKQRKMERTIYSDSRNALLWIKNKKCKTQLTHDVRSAKIYDMIARAENWLRSNTWDTAIKKWDTKEWGEIPADFGRK